MSSFPTLFLSHGSPMLAIQDSPARRFFQGRGKSIGKPKAILVASAHWESIGAPVVSIAPQPETIHDFGGFDEALYTIQYPAPGAPDIAAHAADLLDAAGLPAQPSERRGLDHGAWIPLSLMYPDADIPVAQISVLRGATPTQHMAIGQALAGLRDEGVLVVGSGSLTHNLRELHWHDIAAPVPPWVGEFGDWIWSKLTGGQRELLLDYRRRAPSAARNHPTEEHLLPLFVAMGAAGGGARAERLHTSHEYGTLAMDMYAFS